MRRVLWGLTGHGDTRESGEQGQEATGRGTEAYIQSGNTEVQRELATDTSLQNTVIPGTWWPTWAAAQEKVPGRVRAEEWCREECSTKAEGPRDARKLV